MPAPHVIVPSAHFRPTYVAAWLVLPVVRLCSVYASMEKSIPVPALMALLTASRRPLPIADSSRCWPSFSTVTTAKIPLFWM